MDKCQDEKYFITIKKKMRMVRSISGITRNIISRLGRKEQILQINLLVTLIEEFSSQGSIIKVREFVILQLA